MVSIGVLNNRVNQGYDIISTLMLIVNLVVSFAQTFDGAVAQCGKALDLAEAVTVFFFAVDYVLRVITAEQLYPGRSTREAITKYATSGYGIIDLLSFLPYYLPPFFPSGAAVFRMFRVIRIFRLFRINAYSDSLTLIGNVISGKKTQILASMFIISILILASSLCMYSVEHTVQPEVFRNAFSAIWWATSTLLTVGYGDIYPVTVLGQLLGIVITFLGVGMVAIPTGIISAGFVEQYTAMKHREDLVKETDMRDVDLRELVLREDSGWIGKYFYELGPSTRAQIVLVMRDDCAMIPNERFVFRVGDQVVMYSMQNTDNVL